LPFKGFPPKRQISHYCDLFPESGLEFKLKGCVLMVEVRGLILPMMVTPILIDLPRRVRV